MCRSVVASRVPEALSLRIFLKPKKLSKTVFKENEEKYRIWYKRENQCFFKQSNGQTLFALFSKRKNFLP